MKTKQNKEIPLVLSSRYNPGADPGVQVGGGALEKSWGISCEKSRFYTQKIIFFPILGPPPWIRPCNPCMSKLKQCIIKHWHILNQDEVCKEIFTEKPIIAYKRHRNLVDLLTSTKLKK